MKGQSSIEFLAMVSLSALMLASLQTVMMSKQSAALEYKNKQKAEKVSEYVSFQVEMAMVQGTGYSRVFSLPESIAGQKYFIQIKEGSSYLKWANKSVIQPSRYEGKEINITVGNSNVFRVLNKGGRVKIVEN